MITHNHRQPNLQQTRHASEWAGEIHNANDHFQGSGGLPVAFSGIRRLNNGVWWNANPNNYCPCGGSHPDGRYASFSNNAFFMWDVRG